MKKSTNLGLRGERINRYIAVLFTCVYLLTMGILTVSAQEASHQAKAQEAQSPGYPVTLGGQTIYYVRDTVSGYSPEERARTVSERIKAIAENTAIPTDSVIASDFDAPSTVISAGDKLVVAIFDQDAKAAGKTRNELASEYVRKFRSAIRQYRHDYSLKQTMLESSIALLVTSFLIAVLFFLNRLYHKAEPVIHARVRLRNVSVKFHSVEFIRTERIIAVVSGIMKTVRFLSIIALLYAYLHIVLSLFPWTRPWASHILDYILAPLRTIGRAVLVQIPGLLFVAVIAVITFYLLKFMRLFFNGVESGAIPLRGFYPEWAYPTYRLCRLLVVAFAAVMAFPYVPGSQSPAFKGVSIFLGVLFSLGSTTAVANIVAGYLLTYRRVFRVGDRVKIGDIVGDVAEVRLQVVHLRTIKNEEIIVPSSVIVNSNVLNYSSLARQTGLILHTKVTIGYDAPWRQVEALLLRAAEKTRGILREPVPFVLQTSLDDFYVSYELNVSTDTPQQMERIYTDLHRNIQDAFNEYGVQIMSPSYRFDPERPKIVPKEQWYAEPAEALDTGGEKS